ncbi:hypothetical protein B7486_72910, partial [cyanobacterium TDX16]
MPSPPRTRAASWPTCRRSCSCCGPTARRRPPTGSGPRPRPRCPGLARGWAPRPSSSRTAASTSCSTWWSSPWPSCWWWPVAAWPWRRPAASSSGSDRSPCCACRA